MARKKNIVKSAPNSLRQALLAVKTAILNFSPEHILFLSYEPSSKAMTVKDIPANLESQFILGESGGEGLSPKATVTLKPTGCGAYCLNGGISSDGQRWLQIADGHIYYAANDDQDKWNLVEENGSGAFITYAVMAGSDYMVPYLPIIPENSSYTVTSVSFDDLVNCVVDNNVTTVIDPTREASFTLNVHFGSDIG